MYKVFLKYPESLRPAFPRLKEKLEDPDPGIRKHSIYPVCWERLFLISAHEKERSFAGFSSTFDLCPMSTNLLFSLSFNRHSWNFWGLCVHEPSATWYFFWLKSYSQIWAMTVFFLLITSWANQAFPKLIWKKLQKVQKNLDSVIIFKVLFLSIFLSVVFSNCWLCI